MAAAAADIYKIHVKTRKIVRLTHQEFTPEHRRGPVGEGLSHARARQDHTALPRLQPGALPAAGRQGDVHQQPQRLRMPRGNNMGFNIPLQLFVMDDDGSNVEMIGHLNIGQRPAPGRPEGRPGHVQHPGRPGLARRSGWGIWSIHPDGTNWGPLVSAFGGTAFHFQTQLSDGEHRRGVLLRGKNEGFGTFVKLPPQAPAGSPAFGPAYRSDPRNRTRQIADIGNRTVSGPTGWRR